MNIRSFDSFHFDECGERHGKQVLQTFGILQTKKTLKFQFELNFNNFEFYINIINELVFFIILYLFLLYILLEGDF